MRQTRMISAIAAAALVLSACGSSVGGDPTAYCHAIQTVKDADTTMAPLSAELDVAMHAATSATDPDALTILNAWGRALSDTVTLLDAQYVAAKAAVEDQDVIDALDVQLHLNSIFSRPVADLAVAATSIEDYGNAASAVATSDEFTSLSESIYNSVEVLDAYTQDACGFSFSQKTPATP